MIVLDNRRLKPEFLEGTATNNTRAALKLLLPDRKIRGRAREEVISGLNLDDIEVTPDQFRTAMWSLMDGTISGTYHRMELSDYEFNNRETELLLNSLYDKVSLFSISRQQIETEQPLDVRRVKTEDENEGIDVLYLGEAEAETPEHSQDHEETIDQKIYHFKAYLVTIVPVISRIRLTSGRNGISILTRPIHRGVTPKAQLDGLHKWLEDEMQCPFPSIGGIKAGLRQLMLEKRLQPWQMEVEQSDGCKVKYNRARGKQNESSRDVEDRVRGWDTNAGSFVLDEEHRFRVDTSKAVFSFGGRTSQETADYVIHTVLGSATQVPTT